MSILCDEHEFVTSTIIPFLRGHWDSIDRPEKVSGRRDGRLTRDELELAYIEAIDQNRTTDAFILNEIIMRYEPICRSYSDGYWLGEETVLGMSEADVSVYEQTVDPKFRTRSGSPRTRFWF